MVSPDIEQLEQEIAELRQLLHTKLDLLQKLKQPAACPYSPLKTDEVVRYSRQIIVPQIGMGGQLALKRSKVLIVGAGGLGCPASIYLAAAGIGEIHIVDYDQVELTNLHRQILHSQHDIGVPKVDSIHAKLSALNSDIVVVPHHIHADKSLADLMLNKYDAILDCTDNVATRYLLNDIAVFHDVPLVSGSALQMEGQLTVYNYNGGPCYRCLFPVPPPPDAVTNCGDGGVLGPEDNDFSSSVPEWESSVDDITGELIFINCHPFVTQNTVEKPRDGRPPFSTKNQLRQSTRGKFLRLIRRRESKRHSRRLPKAQDFETAPPSNKVKFQDSQEGEEREVTLKINTMPGVIGVLQALETIKIITQSDGVLSGRLLLFDGAHTLFRNIKLRPRVKTCAVCGDNPTITSPIDYEQFCGSRATDKVINIDVLADNENVTPQELKNQLLGDAAVIDVRPPVEFSMCHLPKTDNLPYSDIKTGKNLIKLEKLIQDNADHGLNVYVLCRRGNDSQRSVRSLKERYSHLPVNFFNVKGGLHAYSRLVDPAFPVY